MPLARYLAGEGLCPTEHYYGELSRHFGGALPTQIAAEQAVLPVGFMERILECRAFDSAWQANRLDPEGWQKSPLRILAKELEHALAREARDRG